MAKMLIYNFGKDEVTSSNLVISLEEPPEMAVFLAFWGNFAMKLGSLGSLSNVGVRADGEQNSCPEGTEVFPEACE